MCHEVTFHNQPAGGVICSCLHCNPSHIPPSTATLLIRLRCLLLNWIHSQYILDHPPCEHIEFFNSFPGKLAQVENVCACNTRTMTVLGLQSNPDVSKVQVKISTGELAGDLSLVEDQATYMVHALAEAFDKDGNVVIVPSEVEGESVELFEMIGAIWVNGGAEDGLERMRNWNAIIRLLRDATNAAYDGKGERLDKDDEMRQVERINDPVNLLAVGGF